MKLNPEAYEQIDVILKQVEGLLKQAMSIACDSEDATVLRELDSMESVIRVFRCAVLDREDHLSIQEAYLLQNPEKQNPYQDVREVLSNVVKCFDAMTKGSGIKNERN